MAAATTNGETLPLVQHTSEKKEKKTRVNVAEKLGLSMPLPRVRTLIRNTVNGANDQQLLKQLNERLTAVIAKKPLNSEDTEVKLNALIKAEEEKYYRLKRDAPMAMTALLDYAVRNAITATFDHCQAQSKPVKTAKPSHIYEAVGAKPHLTALFSLSETFENKLYNNDADLPKKGDKPKPATDEKKTPSKTGFKTYIGHLIKNIKDNNKDKYEKMRVMDPVKIVLDKITQEIANTLSQMACVLCDIDDVRTMTQKHFVKAFEAQMLARHVKRDQFAPLVKFMDAKDAEYATYNKVLIESKKAKEEKKTKEMSPADFNKKQANAHEKELTRLKEAVNKAEKRLEKATKDGKKVGAAKGALDDAKANLKKHESTPNGVKA